MRSQALVGRTRTLLGLSKNVRRSSARTPGLASGVISQCGPASVSLSAGRARLGRRLSSNGIRTTNVSESEPPPSTFATNGNSDDSLSRAKQASGEPPEDPEAPEDESPSPERTKRRRKESSASTKEPESTSLPGELNILWSHLDVAVEGTATLPPPQIWEEALTNLHITLHPQTQHRACYSSTSDQPVVEPTFALYCPIEGGEYVIDDTVRYLARETGSDVVVLDAVHLAAGESGHFGKAAEVLRLPRNPLHFSWSSPLASSGPTRAATEEDEDEDEDEDQPSSMPPMMFHLLAQGPAIVRGRPKPLSRSSNPRLEAFFDELVNIPNTADEAAGTARLIYIRDFPTLAPTASTWFPHLLSAVRNRRKGTTRSPTSPIPNPTTIVFGVTPAMAGPPPPSSSSSSGLVNVLMNRQPPTSIAAVNPKTENSDWGEDESSHRARERRLRDRLRKWERHDAALLDEIPVLPSTADSNPGERRSGVVVVDGNISFPEAVAPLLARASSWSTTETDAKFFRATVLVPTERSLDLERQCRMARRREINELAMRMGIRAVGGWLQPEPIDSADFDPVPGPSAAVLEGESATSDSSGQNNEEETDPVDQQDSSALPQDIRSSLWDKWGKEIETWSTIRQVADRALGLVVSRSYKPQSRATLEPTPVDWEAVHRAWSTQSLLTDIRKEWVKKPSSKPQRVGIEEVGSEDADRVVDPKDGLDEVLEKVKQDPELNSYEQRLLPCIIDPKSMTTTFGQVHLPSTTIDSVRTIVSLPLLHPSAFSHGILKEHGMTGCMLFGPPGTGKTLVVRALAKEAGCRMMAINPSDVMDMYVGEGEKLVKAVFSLARKLSPCVIFLDEIDALFGARMSARESGGAFAHRGVITEFMQEMDGLKSSTTERVIVIGATNRPFDLDDAVLRRLPRRLLIDLPGEKEREEIMKILLRDEHLASDVDIRAIAKKTESFSGSDLKHLCVSAALDAVKQKVNVPWSATSSGGEAPQSHVAVQSDSNTAADTVLTPTSSTSEDDSMLSKDVAAAAASASGVSPEVAVLAVSERTLTDANFVKALKEITPSASESLGSLADLRKWNEEFGEGGKKRKKRMWGKGRFGFIDHTASTETGEDSHVASNNNPLP